MMLMWGLADAKTTKTPSGPHSSLLFLLSAVRFHHHFGGGTTQAFAYFGDLLRTDLGMGVRGGETAQLGNIFHVM